MLAQNNRKITPDQLTCCHHYLSKAQSLRSMMSIIDKQILAFAGAPVTPYTHLLSDAVGYMVDNLESDLSLTSVAAHVNLSPGYFSTLLKKETGMRFAELLGDLRLKRAQDLLKNSEFNINEIAQKCGYTDIAYFSRCFKKRFGVSPSSWRNL